MAESTTNPKAKDTVRKRKRSKKSATQRYLPISEIRNDTVILKQGGLRAVLQVEALNFNLKSETEQMGIIAGYQSFVNSLTFPIQISIRSSKLNIDPYINQLKAMAAKQENPLLKSQINTYSDFVDRIVDLADIMQKRFYVVIPYDSAEEKRSVFSQFMSWMGIDDTSGKATSRYRQFNEKNAKMRDRINLVQTGLQNIGLSSKRLTTKQLIELYYQIYNPKTSQEQKLTGLTELNTENLVL